jgi:hypothetical protein
MLTSKQPPISRLFLKDFIYHFYPSKENAINILNITKILSKLKLFLVKVQLGNNVDYVTY